MQWWISIIKSNFIIMHSTAKIRHRLWHVTKNVSEDGTAMLKLAIKPTFENTTPKDVRWRVYFTASWFSPWNFAGNRRIHVTFVSLSFISCRIYEKWIFIISLRAYITYSDRWSGSQVSAAYRALQYMSQLIFCKSSEYHATLLQVWLYYSRRNRDISPFGLGGAPTFIILVREVGVSMWVFIIKNWFFLTLLWVEIV